MLNVVAPFESVKQKKTELRTFSSRDKKYLGTFEQNPTVNENKMFFLFSVKNLL
jgi:hypothetical protein